MGKRRVPFDEQLRRIIRTCGQSRYQIAKATGIDQASLSKFMLGQRGLSWTALTTLAKHLNLVIRKEQ